MSITTSGDQMSHKALPEIGGKGLFTRELEEALLAGRAQLAVHSLKDLPTELPEGLLLGAIPPREDVRDVLISRSGARLHELPPAARVGTSSPRRAAQLRRARPDLVIEPLRGNLDTRLRKLKESPLEGIVLAAAGIHRLGLTAEVTEYLSPRIVCPAVGQGALAIEARQSDKETLAALAPLDDEDARLGATAERSLLLQLGGGCQIPIAAYTTISRSHLPFMSMDALVISPNGAELIRCEERTTRLSMEGAVALGARCAQDLLDQGATAILKTSA